MFSTFEKAYLPLFLPYFLPLSAKQKTLSQSNNSIFPNIQIGGFLRQNKRNNFFQVVHSAILESGQLGLQLTKENDFTSQLKKAHGTKCNVRMTQLKTKQRHAIFHNNADVKILKIFLAFTREHKKRKDLLGIAVQIYIVPLFFMTYTIVWFPPSMNLNAQLWNKLFIFPEKYQHVHYFKIYSTEFYLKQPIQLSAAVFPLSEALIICRWNSPQSQPCLSFHTPTPFLVLSSSMLHT